MHLRVAAWRFHDLRGDHPIRMSVGEIKETCQVEGLVESIEYAVQLRLHPRLPAERKG
jgi:hypothetical protein